MDRHSMVTTSPNSASVKADQIVVEIIAAIRGGDLEKAAGLADKVLALGMEHPIVYNARGLAFQQKGMHREALTEFTRARSLSPGDINILNAVGVCLINLNQPAQAIQTFDAIIAAEPEYVQAYYRKGWLLEMLGQRDEARKCYERAIEIEPTHADALASLAGAIAVLGEHERARELAERALSINPDQPTAIVAMGVADLAERNFASAERRFRLVIDDPGLTVRARAVVHGLLADALDGQSRTNEAFAAYRFEKNEMRKLYAQSYAGERRPRETTDLITAFLDALPADGWTRTANDDASEGRPAGHVFLLGFPRSGTTLLEQVLASHPDIRALEERDLLADMAQTYLTSEAGLSKLASLGPDVLATHRSNYWKQVGDSGLDIKGKVFVDKLPMHTVKLPLIAKLFPDAKIIFAVRDPRDVVLSCYRRHFEINAAMFEFLTLEDAVDLYTSVMRLGTVAREKMPLAFHMHRYEDMVANFDKSIADICAFVGVEWSDAMRNFSGNAPGLDIKSPSAAQVRRPLNAESVGLWRRYKSHLSPVLPLLRPWAERFDYAVE
jgi:tetratricopeptide (TPR) repeat protein